MRYRMRGRDIGYKEVGPSSLSRDREAGRELVEAELSGLHVSVSIWYRLGSRYLPDS